MADASTTPPDPFQAVRQAYDQAADAWAKTVEQMVSTDEFASVSSKFLKRYVELQEGVRRTSKAYAEALHVPTVDDVARVAQLVVNVERKVDEVADQAYAGFGGIDRLASADAVAALADRLASADAVAALADRLAAIESRLDAVAALSDRLAGIERRLEAAGTAAPAPASEPPATTTPRATTRTRRATTSTAPASRRRSVKKKEDAS